MSDFQDEFIAGTIMIGVLVAVCILGWQVYGYLMGGVWTPISVINPSMPCCLP